MYVNRAARLSLTAFAWIAFLNAAPAGAQTCGLRNHIRLAHGMCNTIGDGETRIDTGAVSAGPLVSPAGIIRDNGCGCHSQLSALITSDYGALSYTVSGQGASCPCCGIFLWADEFIGAMPKAQFFDRLTVASATLPSGAPVTLHAEMTLIGSVSASNASSERSFGAGFTINGNGAGMSLANQAGTVTHDYSVTVGQSFNIAASLSSTLRDNVLLGFNGSGTIGANLSVAVRIVPLSAGVTLASCSGHDYSVIGGCPADFNHDGGVNADDLGDFITCYFGSPPCSDADFNHDGGVNADDLGDFITTYFGSTC